MSDQTLFDMTPVHLKVRPAVARKTDPETSHAAAVSVTRIRESQQYILSLFKRFGPMDDERLAKAVCDNPGVKLSPSGIRTRRSELVQLELLKDSGRTAFTLSGRKTIIWEVK